MLKAIKVYANTDYFTVDEKYAENCEWSFHVLLPDGFYVEDGKILNDEGEWFIRNSIALSVFLCNKEMPSKRIELDLCCYEVIGKYDTIVKLYIIYEKGWGDGEEHESGHCSPNIFMCPGYYGNSNDGSKCEILNVDEYYLPEGYTMHIAYYYRTNSTSHICYDSDGVRAFFGFEKDIDGTYTAYLEDVDGNRTPLKPL